MDNQALMAAIDQLKQGIDALAAAVGGEEATGAEKPSEAPVEAPELEETPDEEDTGEAPVMRGKAVSVEEFLNKKTKA